ncbi:Holliday junction resolvase RecU [Effusibacillus pohliae]|uniref:Holliday junction resolvase RecU n=1 Tax=Effusibacillus pohliae TaxID=232270 RepID=UPI000380D374|nr:Holliday junction resolvase RecU [Effusibacillus pohliae]
MPISQANRGMDFEQLIEFANAQYLSKGWAIIQKVPTPWKVIRRGKQIVSAFPEKKSTVDFVGVFNGRPIAFDAKSTRERTRFELDQVEPHQVDFLRRWQDNGGIAFLLIEFAVLREVYAMQFRELEKWWIGRMRGGRQSIPYQEIRLSCYRVEPNRGIALDYLGAVVSWQKCGGTCSGEKKTDETSIFTSR